MYLTKFIDSAFRSLLTSSKHRNTAAKRHTPSNERDAFYRNTNRYSSPLAISRLAYFHYCLESGIVVNK